MPNKQPPTIFRPMTTQVLHDVTDARARAAEICADLRSGELLDHSFEKRTTGLEPRDRRWTRELVYGLLRVRSRLDAIIGDRVTGGPSRLDNDVLDLLRQGVYQLLYMRSVPAYAAIAQTVELVKRRHGIGASKLANAVLRRIDRERDGLQVAKPRDPVSALALEFSHPEWIVGRWLARFGEEETRALLAANNLEAPLIARPYHIVREQLEAMLESAGIETADAPLLPDSVVLTDGVRSLTELGAFRQGLFHLQDPASTLVTRYAAFAPGSVVADMCAAPGGKAIELARTAALVIASDLSRNRMKRILENITRLEATNIVPLVADASAPPLRDVDAVLVDAPCTGTGTFRRHPDARWRLKASDLAVMPAIQRAILREAATSVRRGGLLVYSTCSLELEENDEQAARFLSDHPGWTLEPPPEGTVPPATLDHGFLRVLPQTHGADGAFAARFRRPLDDLAA